MLPLRNPVQHYDWGSTTAIPQLLGVAPDGRPQAELWLGAHPSAPSLADVGGPPSARWRPLDRLVADEPRGLLGEEVVARFGPRLPFLLKVLAAARPLSLQTHPTLEQARAGYAREEAAGVPRAAPQRSYKDRNHKPELLVALTPFDVLAGFRAPAASVDLFDGLVAAGAGRLRPWVQRLAAPRARRHVLGPVGPRRSGPGGAGGGHGAGCGTGRRRAAARGGARRPGRRASPRSTPPMPVWWSPCC